MGYWQAYGLLMIFRAMGKHINYGKNLHVLHLHPTNLNGLVSLARDISPILCNSSDYPLPIVLYAHGTYLAGKCLSCNRLFEQENPIVRCWDSWGIARGVRQWHQAVPTCVVATVLPGNRLRIAEQLS